jgi:hypothetical protein
MDQKQKDKGIILVLLERFNKIRLPHARAFKKKVDAGEVLGDFERGIIKEVQQDAAKARSLIERNPEYKDLVNKIVNMWNEIIEKDAENQEKQKKY